MYSNIINPLTGKMVNINTILGKELLNKFFIKSQEGGTTTDAEELLKGQVAEEERRRKRRARVEEAFFLTLREQKKAFIASLNENYTEYISQYNTAVSLIRKQLIEFVANIENAHQYKSNVILKFLSGLCKEITVFSEVEKKVNPLLKEFSGYIVDYYEEQANTSSLSTILEDIIKGKMAISRINGNLSEDRHLSNDLPLLKYGTRRCRCRCY